LKKKKKNKETTIENYYDLKIDKVDELVSALKGETDEETAEPVPTDIAEITGEEVKSKHGKSAEFNPYKNDFLSKIPVWLKALFIKFWFAGCVCYFVLMGLGVYITDELDKLVLAGAVLGLITDLMVNPIFRFLETDRKEYNDYMMFPFPFKAFWTFITNILYYIVVALIVLGMYTGINMLVNAISGVPDHYVSVGVEPLLYGVFCVIADMALIGIKDGIVHAVKKAKRKKQLAGEAISAEADEAFGADIQNAQATQGETTGNISNVTDGNAEAQSQSPTAEDGEIDEVEKLRRLAESQNQTAESGGKNKHKKK